MTTAQVEDQQEERREYDRQRSQNPERKEAHRLQERERRRKAKELGICRECSNPRNRARRAANHAPRNTGSPEGARRKEPPGRGTRHLVRDGPSDDTPGPGGRPIVPARDRGKSARWTRSGDIHAGTAENPGDDDSGQSRPLRSCTRQSHPHNRENHSRRGVKTSDNGWRRRSLMDRAAGAAFSGTLQ